MTHRPRTTAGHVAGLLSPAVAVTGRLSLERGAAPRLHRLGAAIRARPTRRMRALVAGPGGRLAWHGAAAPPAPRGRAAVVRPLAVATCDMDRLVALGRGPFPLPLQIGHECVAEVIAVGDEVTTVAVGERVVVPFQVSCGTCPACRRGHTGNCLAVPPLSMYGFGVVGGHWGGAVADELAVPFADAMLVGLPSGVDPVAVASVADTVCDGHRHVAPHLPPLLAEDPDTPVTILAGVDRVPRYSPSGALYAGLAARALGARAVTVVDSRRAVRDLADGLGLRGIPPAELRGVPPARLVVDSSGSPRGLRAALQATAADGVCSSAGGLHTAVRVPTAVMFARNQTLHLGRTHARAGIPAVLDLVARGALRPEGVTTTVADLDDAPRALGAHYRSDEVKTVLTAG